MRSALGSLTTAAVNNRKQSARLARFFISSGRAYVAGDFMSVTTSDGPDSASASPSVVRKGEARASGSVTAGMSDAEFEAWLAAQGAVPMSKERHAAA